MPRTRQSSFLEKSNFRNILNVKFWDKTEIEELEPHETDRIYTVRTNDAIDKISNRFYGDEQLGWVIMAANGIRLPVFELNPGDKIRIPAPRRVFGFTGFLPRS